MLQLTNVDKTKLSEPVLNILNSIELKHAKLGYCLTVQAVQHGHREDFWQLRFMDSRFEGDDSVSPVGTVEWTYGSRNNYEYKITSRKIQNDKFGHWGNEHSSRRTKDVKKATKIAMDNLLPFEWHEISAKGRRDAERAHEKWKDEDSSARRPFMIGHEGVFEEIKHLVEMGVEFKTPFFKNAAAGIADYEEFIRKSSIKPKFNTVLIRPDKTIFIPDGRCLETTESSDIDTLPEATRNAIALLKLVGTGSLLPEIGYRGGENTYFILV